MTTLDFLFKNDMMPKKKFWKLKANVNGYEGLESNKLSTQAKAGRVFSVVNVDSKANLKCDQKRIKVRLMEDGYICWFETKDLENQIIQSSNWESKVLSKEEIKKKIPQVLKWVERQSKHPNKYLWGGTTGPDFDCSGLIQTAFAYHQIWLPRDAYQQEMFCKSIAFDKKTLKGVLPGDLIFFGSTKKCSHVALYKGKGLYWHSSGIVNGRNGIALDKLLPNSEDAVSFYYQSQLRGVGRVENCHAASLRD